MVNLLTSAEANAAPRLTAEEHVRLRQLECLVEKHLDSFLAVGKALAAIKAEKLYRQHYSTFESYLRERWALSRSRADELIRSTATAELLLANGVALPPSISEAALRPVSALPSPELQVQAWRLVQAASPAGVTQPISSKICRTIRNAIETPGAGTSPKPRSRSHPSRERPFVQAAIRLANWDGFEANFVISHIEKLAGAMTVYTACGTLADRCEKVRGVLVKRFPQLQEVL
jgi:hypothetical protein